MPEPRRLEQAAILSIGTELLVGETRDTNSGDLARDLTARGVQVVSSTALPDRQAQVVDALRRTLDQVDLLVSTGGLGPTPDDLTRESIAEVCGATPRVDPELERWLRGLWDRRGLPFVDANLKQAWLIEGASALPNANGTAPGWWVDRLDGRVIVALPGPPREMWPIWRDAVVPRLEARGVGADRTAETLRLTGIGESLLVDLIGDPVLRASNPEVATYARADAVDVRVSAVSEGGRSGRELVDRAIDTLMPRLAPYVFARGDESWPEALAHRLGDRSVAFVEMGTGGQLGALIGGAPWLVFGELVAPASAIGKAHRGARAYADAVRTAGGAEVGLAVRARERGGDMAVTIAVSVGSTATSQVTRTAFLGGDMGRRRAAILACAELWSRLGDEG